MKKQWLCLLMVILLMLPLSAVSEEKRFTASFLDLFDTVTYIVGYAESADDFRAVTQQVYDELETYHQLFDIYNTYEGMNNLKTINDQAGLAPVEVDGRIIELMSFCRQMAQETGGLVDVTAGAVLSLWHDARVYAVDNPLDARLPEESSLQEAALHTGFDKVLIDENASTVFLTDPMTRLDVGAIAKGYAVEKVAQGMPVGMMLSVGGNVRVTGSDPVTGKYWTAGVQDPQGTQSDFLHIVQLDGVSIVTSGSYHRYFTVDGVRYGHIIDPRTLAPGDLWAAVCILCPDSGVADALSTALYLLPAEDGQQLLERFGAQAMWIAHDGSQLYSPGFESYILQ